MSTKNYIPIPVEAAQELAEKYQKSQVLIVAVDPVHGLFHYTTFGVGAEDKVAVAHMADTVADIISDGDTAKVFEDFRAGEAAQYKAQLDEAEKQIRSLKNILVQHWLCLKFITKVAGIDESSSVKLSMPGRVIGEYTLSQVLSAGSVAFAVVQQEAAARKEGKQAP